MTEARTLRVERKAVSDGSLRLVFSGPIDERAELACVFDDLPDDVILDLSQAQQMNSLGIVRWRPFIAALTKQRRTRIEGVSYSIALRAHCAAHLFGDAEVRSCHAPYRCTTCGMRSNMLVAREELADHGQPPAKSCPGCDAEMSFEEVDGFLALLEPQLSS